MSTPAWPEGTVVALATTDEDGAPHVIPVSAALADGDDILLGLAGRRGSLDRLRAAPAVAVLVLARDLALTLRGRAEVVREALPGAERVAGVRVAVEAADDHGRDDVRIEAGVRWSWTASRSAERDADVMAGLRGLLR